MGDVEIIAIAKDYTGKERKVTVRTFVQVRDVVNGGNIIKAVVTDNFTGEFLTFGLEQLRAINCGTCKNYPEIGQTSGVCQNCYSLSKWEDNQK